MHKRDIATNLFVSLVAVMSFVPYNYVLADDNQKINLKLDTSSHSILILKDSKKEIIPGESLVQREEREKAEAEKKEKAIVRTDANNVKSVSKTSIKTYSDPVNFDQVYQKAQEVYGVDWRILKAVHYVETGCSGSTSKSSYAGAVGPMQFLPSTFRSYGVDGNGDGVADITNLEDAVFTAAKYLKACGYPDVKKALWGYNRSTSYYYKVMEVAKSLGF